METRAQRIMQLLQAKDKGTLEYLEIPRHESTKGLLPRERKAAVSGFNKLVLERNNREKSQREIPLDEYRDIEFESSNNEKMDDVHPDLQMIEESIQVTHFHDHAKEVVVDFQIPISSFDGEQAGRSEQRDGVSYNIEPLHNLYSENCAPNFEPNVTDYQSLMPLVPYSDTESSIAEEPTNFNPDVHIEESIQVDHFQNYSEELQDGFQISAISSSLHREMDSREVVSEQRDVSYTQLRNLKLNSENFISTFSTDLAELSDSDSEKQSITRSSDNRSDSFEDSDYKPSSSDSSSSVPDPESSSLPLASTSCEKRQNTDSRTSVFVMKNNNYKNHRVYDKKDACFFCGKLFSKLIKHLEAVHTEEKEVSKFLALRKNSNERRLAMQNIRNKGNFIHNKNVLDKNEGTILTRKRPVVGDADVDDYLPCEYCLGFYVKSHLARHSITCAMNPRSKDAKKRQNSVVKGQILLSVSSKTSDELKQILSSMKNDEISLIVRNDELIKRYGETLCNKYRNEIKHLQHDISQKMRELARLLIVIQKENNKICSLESALKPEYFMTLINSVKELCSLASFNENTKPTLALKLGYSIQKCVGILRSDAIIGNLETKKKSAESFLTLYDIHWSSLIARTATDFQDKAKYNKPSLIPLADDVRKMNLYIQKETDIVYDKLTSPDATEADYTLLRNLTLAHLIVFNRKRVGEVERLEKKTYLHRNTDIPQGEIEKSLSECEKILLKRITLIDIRGKRGRKVPLLLTPKMMKNIDLLLLKRDTFKVPPTNEYIFGRIHSDGFYRGCDAIRSVSANCGAQKPENLTSTRLRKHIATVSQILNLNDNEIEQLSKHLGHNLNVHKNFYRLPDNTLELAKVSKLLLLFEKGDITSGMNLDNIVPDIDFNQENDESDTENEEESDDYSDDCTQPTRANIFRKAENLSKKKINKNIISEISEAHQRNENTSDDEIEDFSPPIQSLIRGKIKNKSASNTKKVKRPNKSRSVVRRNVWSKEENQAVNNFFRKNIVQNCVPNKAECEKCISENSCLKNRSWVVVKSKVKNIITTNTRRKANF